MSTEYRILGPDEIVEEGDEISYRSNDFWVNCRTTIGEKAGYDPTFKFRRAITQDKAMIITNGTYLTAGGYVVTLDEDLISPVELSPGMNSNNQPSYICNGWMWKNDGTITLNEEWSEKLKIVEKLQFELPPCPSGYKWAGGYPQYRRPKEGEYFIGQKQNEFKSVFKASKYYVVPHGCDDRRLIVEPKEVYLTVVKPNEFPKYYKRRNGQPFYDGSKYMVRHGDTRQMVNSDIKFSWTIDCDNYVKEGSWIEVDKPEVEAYNKSHKTEKEKHDFGDMEGWRLLRPSEILKEGDEYFSKRYSDGWAKLSADDISHTFNDYYFYRRRIQKPIKQEDKTIMSKAITYWVTEPARDIKNVVVKSFRYILFTSVLFGGAYGIANPKVVLSYLPKVTISAPEIMQNNQD